MATERVAATRFFCVLTLKDGIYPYSRALGSVILLALCFLVSRGQNSYQAIRVANMPTLSCAGRNVYGQLALARDRSLQYLALCRRLLRLRFNPLSHDN